MQETRLYDPDKGETRSMRSKEDAHDYRYFPDPDLLPLVIDQAWIDAVRATLPELPDQKAQRFVSEYGLSAYDAGVLTASARAGRLLRGGGARRGARGPKLAANWVMGELAAAAQPRRTSRSPPAASSAAQLARLLQRIADGTISGKIAKEVFEAMWDEGSDADAIIDARGPAADLRRRRDRARRSTRCSRPIRRSSPNTAPARTSCSASSSARSMKATGGKANPAQLNELLKKKLSS